MAEPFVLQRQDFLEYTTAEHSHCMISKTGPVACLAVHAADARWPATLLEMVALDAADPHFWTAFAKLKLRGSDCSSGLITHKSIQVHAVHTWYSNL